MAENEEGAEVAPRGNEWEVVSLTASAYAAAPGPKHVDSSHDNLGELGGENEAETSTAMLMSGHFVFPPSQHENLPLEPEHSEIHDEKGGEYDFSQLVAEEGVKSVVSDEKHMNIKGLMSDEFPGTQVFDEKDKRLSASGAEFEKDVVFHKGESIYSTTEFHSYHCEATIDEPNTVEEGEETDDSVSPPRDQSSDSELSNSQKPAEAKNYDDGSLPCEAWWKRQAVSLYGHVKEANTFWSIFVAATVMGLVILGHSWQQERWRILHKWQLGVSDERMGRMLGPISRLKDVIVGGHRRGSLVRGSTSTER